MEKHFLSIENIQLNPYYFPISQFYGDVFFSPVLTFSFRWDVSCLRSKEEKGIASDQNGLIKVHIMHLKWLVHDMPLNLLLFYYIIRLLKGLKTFS